MRLSSGWWLTGDFEEFWAVVLQASSVLHLFLALSPLSKENTWMDKVDIGGQFVFCKHLRWRTTPSKSVHAAVCETIHQPVDTTEWFTLASASSYSPADTHSLCLSLYMCLYSSLHWVMIISNMLQLKLTSAARLCNQLLCLILPCTATGCKDFGWRSIPHSHALWGSTFTLPFPPQYKCCHNFQSTEHGQFLITQLDFYLQFF